MSDIQLGKEPLVDAKRDAVHVAIVPLVATERMFGGHPFTIVDDKVRACGFHESIGSVDPFIYEVQKGQRFWAILKPGTAKNLRHDWDCPELDQALKPKADEVVPAMTPKEWLMDFAKRCGTELEVLLHCAVLWSDMKNHGLGGPFWLNAYGPITLLPVFWENYDAYMAAQVLRQHEAQAELDRLDAEDDDSCRGC